MQIAGTVAESFFGTLKVELLYELPLQTRGATRTAVTDYIENFYNVRRRHSSLDYMSPVEFELKHPGNGGVGAGQTCHYRLTKVSIEQGQSQPPSARVRTEMAGLIDWFNQTAPTGTDPLPLLARAGIAHLYFESIHPFEDGNGRIGRALAVKALAQTLGQPSLVALAHTIEHDSRVYYAMLESSNKENEITSWLVYFAETILQAQRTMMKHVE